MDKLTVDFLRECLKREIRVRFLANVDSGRYKEIGTGHIADYCYLSDDTVRKFLSSKVVQPNRKTLALIKHCLKIPTKKRISIVGWRYPDGFLRFARAIYG